MIIWSGLGIMIPFLLGLFIWLTGFLFSGQSNDDYLHMSLACLATAFLWYATLRKSATHLVKVDEAEESLRYPERLGDQERKQAEMLMKSKKGSEMWKDSSLFFIPGKWWPHILGGLSILFLVLHFTT